MSSRGARSLVAVAAAAGTLACAGGALADRGGVPNGGREDRPQPQGPPAAQEEPQQKATPPGQEQRPATRPTPPGQERRSAPRPRNRGRGRGQGEGRGQDKTTICHATSSETNPFVRITVANPSLPAHARHGDLIPAAAGDCPGGTQATGARAAERNSAAVAPQDTGTPPPGTPEGTAEQHSSHSSHNSHNSAGDVPVSGVLGATAEAPAQGALPANNRTGDPAGSSGSLPFTGLQLLLLVVLGATALAGGHALRRGGAIRPA